MKSLFVNIHSLLLRYTNLRNSANLMLFENRHCIQMTTITRKNNFNDRKENSQEPFRGFLATEN